MAGKLFTLQIAKYTVSSATTTTLIQLVPGTNHPVKILGYGVYGYGVNPIAVPGQCWLALQTTAGTMDALTPAKIMENDNTTIDATAQQAKVSGPAEPTTTTVYDIGSFHGQSFYEFAYPLGQEPIITTRCGLLVSIPVGIDIRAKLRCEE